MKKRRFLKKALSPAMILIYILFIAIVSTILSYSFGGLKASTLDKTNKDFDYDGFVSQSDVEYENEDYNVWIGQNDDYVLYFNPANTIATIYLIEDTAKTGIMENGHEVIDITKCSKYYTTAQNNYSTNSAGVSTLGAFSEKNANLILHYATDTTGSANYVNTSTNSVNYIDKNTGKVEKHYSIKYIEDGVQVLYSVGTFFSAINYFPNMMYQTMYKPIEEGYKTTEAYENAMKKWISYMKFLGVENPEEASDKIISNALANTFEERFRGNCAVLNSTKREGSQINVEYTGSMYVYTQAGFDYIKNLIDSGEIEGMYDEEVIQKSSQNCWYIEGLSDEFLTSYGKYFNCDDSPLTVNPFIYNSVFANDLCSAYSLVPIKDDAEIKDGDIEFSYYDRSEQYFYNNLERLYNLLYSTHTYTNAGGELYYKDGELLYQGGYAARDEENNFMYDDEGNIIVKFYTEDITNLDNDMFNYEVEATLPLFSVCLEFKLTADGLETTILSDSLIDCTNAEKCPIELDSFGNKISDRNSTYILAYIDVLPYMTYVDNTGKADGEKETGQIVVPDGSGAVINFNSVKSNATAVNTSYYGSDKAFTSKSVTEDSQDLLLGMYGFISTTPTNPRALLSIIEKGGNQVSLFATTDDKIARAYFSGTVRKYTTVYIGTSSRKTPYVKWAKQLSDCDLQFKFMLLGEDETDYVSLANRYRDYLVEKDNIEEKDTTDKTVVDLNFLGSFEKYSLFLGFKYKTPASLTTFNQAQDIIEELSNGITVDNTVKKVSEFNVSYTAWTNEEMEYEVGGNLSVSSVLGGKKGLQNLVKYLDSKKIDFYAENYVTTTKGYDVSFGDLKYTSRDSANNTAIVYSFDPAIQRIDKSISATHVLNPSYYSTVANDLIKKIEKLNITSKASKDAQLGYYLVDLGNMSAGSYDKNEEIYGEEAIQYQLNALNEISKNNLVKISAPYDYAFKYTDMITDIPLVSTANAIYDETIPFYQLVVSGLVDYTCEQINGTSNKNSDWYFAKAIESGSNLSFVISAENPTVLLDTDYTYFYKSYYQNWKEKIVTMASELDTLGIASGRLTYHHNIGKNIANVKYTLDNNSVINLYVNTTGSDYNYNGIIIPAYGYVKIA